MEKVKLPSAINELKSPLFVITEENEGLDTSSGNNANKTGKYSVLNKNPSRLHHN